VKKAGAPVSASELTAYECERRGAARYLTDDPMWKETGPQGQFMTGTRLHSLVEGYLRSGKSPTTHGPIEDMFMSVLPYLPTPGAGKVIEERCTGTLGGVPYEVRPDWFGYKDVLSDLDSPDSVPWVVDIKSSIDPKAYGYFDRTVGGVLSSALEQKLKDAQSLLYAYHFGKGEDTLVTHVYALKHRVIRQQEFDKIKDRLPVWERDKKQAAIDKAPKNPRGYESPVLLTKQDISRALVPLQARAERVFQLRTQGPRNPLDLEPNWDRCNDFGGCPHKGICLAGTDPLDGLNDPSNVREPTKELAKFEFSFGGKDMSGKGFSILNKDTVPVTSTSFVTGETKVVGTAVKKNPFAKKEVTQEVQAAAEQVVVETVAETPIGAQEALRDEIASVSKLGAQMVADVRTQEQVLTKTSEPVPSADRIVIEPLNPPIQPHEEDLIVRSLNRAALQGVSDAELGAALKVMFRALAEIQGNNLASR
jgi:hypothetical protein